MTRTLANYRVHIASALSMMVFCLVLALIEQQTYACSSAMTDGLNKDWKLIRDSRAFISSLLGWGYLTCWTVGYFPQLWLNYQLKSTAGLSIDFCMLNFVSYVSYTVFTVTMYFDTTIQQQYNEALFGGNASDATPAPFDTAQCSSAARRQDAKNLVTVQDVAYSIIATLNCLTYLLQIYYYHYCYTVRREKPISNARHCVPCSKTVTCEREQVAASQTALSLSTQTSSWLRFIALFFFLWCLFVLICNSFGYDPAATHRKDGAPMYIWRFYLTRWLGIIYGCALLKLAIQCVKYYPQLALNMRRRLTLGWSVHKATLSLLGAVLAGAQELFDAFLLTPARNANSSSINTTAFPLSNVSDGHVPTDDRDDIILKHLMGNFIKIGLAIVSAGYCCLFIVQHYVLYRRNNFLTEEALRLTTIDAASAEKEPNIA